VALRLSALAASVLSSVLLGCGKAGDIVGTWTESEQHLTVQYKPDGTFMETVKKGPLSFIYEGHYSLTGNNLRVTWDKAKLDKASPALQQEFQDSIQGMVGKENESVVEFLNPDRINLTRGGTIETFDRVKS
jgi:hypothetical protein